MILLNFDCILLDEVLTFSFWMQNDDHIYFENRDGIAVIAVTF